MNQAVFIQADGKKREEFPLESPSFNEPLREALIHQVVVAGLSQSHRGTVKTKGRGEVSGGGAKPWRQKGTGHARAGSSRSPIWRSGGVAFGPQPRSRKKNTNRKSKRIALCSLMSNKAAAGSIVVLDSIWEPEQPSTRLAKKWIARLQLRDQKVLFVDEKIRKNTRLSMRNIQRVCYIAVDQLNILNAIGAKKIVFTKESLKQWEKKIGGTK